MDPKQTIVVGISLFASACLAGGIATRPAESSWRPLGYPIYLVMPTEGEVVIDGKLDDPAWRGLTLGWGMSHALEPNVLCPDPTLFRMGWSPRSLYLSLTCHKRNAQDDPPQHLWHPREPELMDTQAIERHARERGVVPPVNTADVLISTGGRTVTLTFSPPEAPRASVHDAVGDRPLNVKLEYAYASGPVWTVEARVDWDQLGFGPPKPGDDWALNVYRDIRFFSNWAFIGWMRQWEKAEYSRYDLTERFGRMLFVGRGADPGASEAPARAYAARRGALRIFEPDALLIVEPNATDVTQRYAETVVHLRAYGESLLRERSRMGNDLPYHPFYPQTRPSEQLNVAVRQLTSLREALSASVMEPDPAMAVALIAHAIPEAREALYTYRKERLYRGLPE